MSFFLAIIKPLWAFKNPISFFCSFIKPLALKAFKKLIGLFFYLPILTQFKAFKTSISLFVALALLSSPVFAKTQDQELLPALSLSQAGSGGASLKEDFSYLLNPALIAFQKKSKGGLAYSFKKQKHLTVLSFLDAGTKFPLSITYQRFWSKSFKKRDKESLTLGSALKVAPYISFGVSTQKELRSAGWTGILGSNIRLAKTLSMAVFLNQNFTNKKFEQRDLSLAFYYSWRNFFSSQVDITKKPGSQNWLLTAGVESFFHDFFSVRLGGTWFYKTQDLWFAGGLNFKSPKLLLEYAVLSDQKTYQHAIVLGLFI